MNWQAVGARGRGLLLSIRSRLTRRTLLRVTLATFAIGFVMTTGEALLRAHLSAPGARLPATFYSRPVAWRDGSERLDPVPIGTLDGSPMDERIPVRLSQVPDALVQAVLAVEDQRFFEHHGFDFRRIAGALIADIRAGGISQGGSTITQQLAKNLFLNAHRTPLRKLREAAMAVVLELRYTKRQILEAYLNEIYLGQDGARAIHGVGAASRYYFGKSVGNVTLAEAAQLAAMISAPNRTIASRHPDAAQQRRDMVLDLMQQQQRITSARAERASRSPLTIGEHSSPMLDSRYFRDFVATTLDRRTAPRGTAIYTTLDAGLQRAAERAVRQGTSRPSLRGAEAALVAIDPRTGEVLAMVGGRDYGSSQFNRAVDAHRQPGSAFKPIVALTALERRNDKPPVFTLASVVEDEPLSVKTRAGLWQPANYDREFRGPVTVREALEESLNVPFARIGLAVGPDRIVANARQLGIASPLHAVPSLALGSSEVTLLELVRAYGVLATEGTLAGMHTVLARRSGAGQVQLDTAIQRTAVADPAATYLVTSALQGVVTRGTGRALNEDGRFGAIAGKTGTSNDWRDAWFIAYSPSLVVGVWVGYDDGRSLQMTGAAAALPIAESFLAQATPEDGWEPFEVPDGVTEAYAGSSDGSSMGECGTQEVFLTGTEPAETDCSPGDLHIWRGAEDLGAAIARGARRLLEGLLARQIEIHHSRR